MSKKIAVLTSTWVRESSKSVIAGIIERAGDDDVELHIFNAYDSGREIEYFRKGREIYFLPDPDQYDGMIISLATVASSKYVNEIATRFHDANKPVVGLDTHAENAIFCGLDNYRSMYRLVEHMITIHDCRTINYLGGPEENAENAERYRAFCDCLAAHNINVEKRRVLFKRFWKADGNAAYNEWKKTGANMADVVICANDYMALGYVEEAEMDGVSIPDYMKVTGFDNIEEAQQYSPSITSVNRNWKMLGYESMDALYEAMEGNTEFDTRYVEGLVTFNESCGCDTSRDIRSEYNRLVERFKNELQVDLRRSYARQELSKCRNEDEYGQALAMCKEMLGFEEMAVYLNTTFFNGSYDMDLIGYDEEMTVYTGKEKYKVDHRQQLYPEKWKEKEKVFLFSSLRNSRQTYGYVVMPYRSEYLDQFSHRNFVESLSLSLEKINLSDALKMKDKS